MLYNEKLIVNVQLHCMSSPEWLHITQEGVLAKVARSSGVGSALTQSSDNGRSLDRVDPTHVDAEVAEKAGATQQGTGDAKRGDDC